MSGYSFTMEPPEQQRKNIQDASPFLRPNVLRPSPKTEKSNLQNRLGTKPQPPNKFQHNQNNNFNRKRFGDKDTNGTPAKRRWYNNNNYNNNNNRPSRFHSNHNNYPQVNVPPSIQSRLDGFKNQVQISPALYNKTREFDPDISDSDITDITVKVVNDNTASSGDSEVIQKFKMILDQGIQRAIRVLQSKRKEKQIILPVPVTPNTTMVSLHERFSFL